MAWAESVTLASTFATGEAAVDELEILVREHARLVFKVAYSVLRHREDAEDAVQETFLRMVRKGPEHIREPRLWLARVAWRIALDRVRRPSADSLEDLGQRGTDFAAESPDAEQLVIDAQMRGLMQRLITGLPRELREVITLSTVQQMSAGDIAAVLEIPEGSVRNRLFRARQMLREKLAAAVG